MRACDSSHPLATETTSSKEAEITALSFLLDCDEFEAKRWHSYYFRKTLEQAREKKARIVKIMEGHGFSPLALCGEKRHTIRGSSALVTPRFGFAPPLVPASDGALRIKGLGRWFNGDFYRVTFRSAFDSDGYPHCQFRLSLAAQVPETHLGGLYLTPIKWAPQRNLLPCSIRSCCAYALH